MYAARVAQLVERGAYTSVVAGSSPATRTVMGKQIVVIHGGETFETYEEYKEHLHYKELSREKLKQNPDWKATLEEQLGEEYDVLLPRMPNKDNARFSEWSIIFQKVLDICAEPLVLVGHSLGGVFLAKYLSENTVSNNIEGLILVAAPFEGSKEESLSDFILPDSLEQCAEQCTQIALFHSTDDPVVPFEQSEKYMRALPNTKRVTLSEHGHCNNKDFPELVTYITSL